MSFNCTPTFILRICKVFFPGLVLLTIGSATLISAQPLHPLIQLKQPSQISTNALDNLQKSGAPSIGLYYSRRAAQVEAGHRARVEENIRQWEYLLIGLQLPYVLISDSLFSESKTNSLDILIVPVPETLPDSSLQILQHFVREGGGLIASGYSGLTAENRGSTPYVEELAGIGELVPMGRRTGKIRQKLQGGHAIGKNLPIGFELDLLSNQTAYVAYVDEGEAVGPAVVSGELQPFTCMVTHAYGKGRVVWMGFSPQDIPPSDEQQRGYQEIILDAFVFASESAYASIRRWPQGYQSAVSFVQLPSSGYQPFSYRTSTDLLLRAFARHDIIATYFVVLRHAQDHPDLLERMATYGELGLVSDSPKPLSGLPEELQHERLSVAKWMLESEYGQSIYGALPPGYFYDANTLQVLSKLDIQYVLSDARHLQEPVFIEWDKELDYRDSMVVPVKVDSLPNSNAIHKPDPLIRIYPTLFSYDLDAPLSEREKLALEMASFQERWASRLKSGFEDVHENGGLFAFGFEPETMGLSEQRAGVLESFIKSLRDRNSWNVSLSKVIEWWRKRDQLIVFMEEATPGSTTLRIENTGKETLNDVSLDVFAPEMALSEADSQADGLEITVEEQRDGLYLVQIKSLAKGVHTIKWAAGLEKTVGEIEP